MIIKINKTVAKPVQKEKTQLKSDIESWQNGSSDRAPA
jgi:hypothetical protein